MYVVDSCGWVAGLAGTPLGDEYREALVRPDQLILPAVCLLEVARHVMDVAGQRAATEAVSLMGRTCVVPLDGRWAREAALVGHCERLSHARAVALATATRCGATLWTHDEDLRGRHGVRFVTVNHAQ
jgi:toxin FitB